LQDQYTSSAEPRRLAAGTELRTRRTIDGMPCRFRTGYPVEMWPIEVVECAWQRPEQIAQPPRVPDAVAVVRMRLRVRGEFSMEKLGIEHLTMYLNGEKGLTLPLYELLSRNLMEVLVRNPASPGSTTVSLGAGALRVKGFEVEEGLLPYTARSFQGHRLLQEYFAFPEKFLFFDLFSLELASRAMQAQELEVLFYLSSFDQPERWQSMELGVSAQTLRLGCTPVVNLFTHAAEPITLTQTRHEYPVIASARYESLVEVYSIDSVTAANPSRRTFAALQPLFHHQFGGDKATKVYWRTRRERSVVDERKPSQLYLSIVDREGLLTEPDAEVLTLHVTSTNGDLPSKLTLVGEGGDFEQEGAANAATIRALHRPTSACEPPAGPGQMWGLISQLSLNHLSLGEQGLPALKEILRRHNFSGAPHLSKQIDGITAMTAKPHLAVMEGAFGSVAARGTRLDLTLREENFAGGGAFLFSAVLERFFGLYVSMNSFSQLVVRTDVRKEVLGTWPPRAGRQLVM